MVFRTWFTRLRRRLNPEATLQARLRRLSANVASSGRDAAARTEQMARGQDLSLKAASDRLETLALDDVKESVRALRSSVRRQLKYSKALLDLRRTMAPPVDTAAIIARLARMTEGQRPILVGPWTGDVGLELLYWAPFVRWFATRFDVPPDRLRVISRGGAPWYGDCAKHYTEILSLCTPMELRAGTRAPTTFRGFERQIVRDVRREHPGHLLHPGIMHRLFAPYWRHDVSLRHVARLTAPPPQPERSAAGVLPPLPDLPSRFLAVRCAFGPAFPDTPANRMWLDALMHLLTQTGDVVWLGSGLDGSDGTCQTEYEPAPAERLHRIDHLLTPERAIATQAAVIAQADAYVGTYGGLCYVAPLYGVRSIAFYSVRGFFPHHRGMADHIFEGRHSLTVLDVADTSLLRSVLDAATHTHTPVS